MSAALPLSILDIAPISEGSSAAEVLTRTPELARLGDTFGYSRIWYAEHHGLPNIGASVPEVMIAMAGAHTHRIRIGAGGIMLPNHVPLKVVESFRTLNALYPGRVDLGLGRAGGTDQLTMRALRSFGGEEFPSQVAELLAFERGAFPENHPFTRVRVTPEGIDLPPIWVLGSSGAGAEFAGQLGLGYAFAAHFSPAPARPAFEDYRAAFTPSPQFDKPHAILCLPVVCAETDEEAEFLAGSMKLTWLRMQTNRRASIPSPETARDFPYSESDRAIIQQYADMQIAGSPETVRRMIEARAEIAGADEVMVTCVLYDHAARLRSFELIAEAFEL